MMLISLHELSSLVLLVILEAILMVLIEHSLRRLQVRVNVVVLLIGKRIG